MKTWIALILTFVSVQSFADTDPLCSASPVTTQKIETLRFVELPYKIVKGEIMKVLKSDECVMSRVSENEIGHLAKMLMAQKYADRDAGDVIAEYMAM